MSNSSAISTAHQSEPRRIAEAGHSADDARAPPVKRGGLEPTKPPGSVPLAKPQTRELSSNQAAAIADEAYNKFHAARVANQPDVDDLKSKAIVATAASLKVARAVEQAAMRNHSEPSSSETRRLSDAVFSACGLWQQARETELGLALTAEDAVLGMVGLEPVALDRPVFVRNVDAWNKALGKAKAALERQANESTYADVAICEEGLERAKIFQQSLAPPVAKR
jgi:hypothetical protein